MPSIPLAIKKILRLSPFIVLCSILVVTWYKVIIQGYPGTIEYYLASGLVVLNLLIYFVRFRYGIMLTGILLSVGLLGILSFYPVKMQTYFGVTIGTVEIRTPDMEISFLLILLLYLVVNANSIWHFMISRREKRSNGK